MNNASLQSQSQSRPQFLQIIFAIGLALFVAVAVFSLRGGRIIILPGQRADQISIGNGWDLTIYGRISSGLQRADDVAFVGFGSRVVMSCPRYEKLTVWEFGYSKRPKFRKSVDLQGRPQKLVPFEDKLFVVERPPGDDRHIKPGFYEVFDREGNQIAGPFDLGWDPDDMAIIKHENNKLYALILLSGNAEGEDNRPNPSVRIVEIDPHTFKLTELAETEIPDAKNNNEDPLRIVAGTWVNSDKTTQHMAMITMGRNGAIRRLNWSDPKNPVWNNFDSPQKADPLGATLDITGQFLITSDRLTSDLQKWPLAAEESARLYSNSPMLWTALAALPNHNPVNPLPKDHFPAQLAAVSEMNSLFGLIGNDQHRYFKLHGPYGFGSVRPMAVAVWQERLDQVNIAVCDRTGGLHLMELSRTSAAAAAQPAKKETTSPALPQQEKKNDVHQNSATSSSGSSND